MKKFFGLLLAAVMTFSLVACGAQNVPSDNTSDDYPSGPITCIVPYAAGGGSDVMGGFVTGISTSSARASKSSFSFCRDDNSS